MHGLMFALGLAAAPAGVEATWKSDGTCPQEQFQRSLDDYLAGVVAREPLRAAVRVRQAAPGRWTLTLTLSRAGDTSVRARRLAGSSCASVSEAAAFVTAVAVDPTVIERAPAGPGAPVTADPQPRPEIVDPEPPAPAIIPPVPEAPASAPPPAPASDPVEQPPAAPELAPAAPAREPAPVARPRPRPRGFVRLAGGFEAFGAPQVGAQVQLAAGLSGRTWRVELRGMYRAPTRVDPWPDLPAFARIGLWTVGAHGCAVLRPGPLEVPLCGGLEAGQTPGVGRGFPGARPDRLPWVAAVFGPALAWAPRPRFAVWLGLEAALPITRSAFHISGLGLAHETGPVSLRGALGFELRFP
jgi:hypothetical protein